MLFIRDSSTGLPNKHQKFLSPGDRRQKENRVKGRRRGLPPAFPLKTAGREQHTALQSGEAEVGRGWATYQPKVASSSDKGPSSGFPATNSAKLLPVLLHPGCGRH